MHVIKHTENDRDRLEIRDPQPEELFSGELLRSIWQGRSMPWAWRDQTDYRLVHLADDFGTHLTYRILGYDHALDTFRMQLVLFPDPWKRPE